MLTLRFRRVDEIRPEDQRHLAFFRSRVTESGEIGGTSGAQAQSRVLGFAP